MRAANSVPFEKTGKFPQKTFERMADGRVDARGCAKMTRRTVSTGGKEAAGFA
jgi:hypothetical protein